jgi:choline dehydrogenase-like flavoprotein
MAADNHYDVIIIGTGAGGGTLAYRLAPSGKRILLLERGEYLPREKDNWDSRAVFVESKYRANETWYDKDRKAFHPGIQYYVGGNTKVYGAALLRFRREDFGAVMHYGGISPAWPLSYEDFEPWYTKAEHLYHVHGQRGVDPTEGPAGAPYRYPPVSHAPRIQELFDDFRRLGHHPFPLPLGILLDEAAAGKAEARALHTSACVRCPAFDGFPCLVNGKADAQVICVDPALQYSNVELLTGAYVERLETNPSGRVVTKVIVRRNGAEQEYSADIVVVSCGAINSAALLLRSANEKHPGGLANSSDVVGRHYMRHNCSAFMAISRNPNPTTFQKTLALNDFYFGSEDWEFPLGEIQMLGKSDGEMIKAEAPGWAVWKPEFALDFLAEHSIDFWLQSEDLPDANNRVTIDHHGQIVLSIRESNLEGHKRLAAKLKAMLTEIGCHDQLMDRSLYLGKNIPIGGTAHQAGTIRFGVDPKTSALDLNCKAHDLDNLYVVDASFFVSIAAVNPSLTIMANALRVGDHLLERLGSAQDRR